MRLAAILLLTAVLSACASTAMKPYLGKTETDVQLDWGKPENRIPLPDGRVAVQYRWGGGTFAVPGNSTTTATMVGNSVYMNTQTMPSAVIESEGCLVTFILRKRGGTWVVDETRYPDRAFC